MANDETKIKMLTLEEANALLPQIRLTLKSLRELRSTILRTQAQIEIEEMTNSSPTGTLSDKGEAAVSKQLEALHYQSRQFEEKLYDLEDSGAHLKDLDRGLIDFYSRRGQDVIFLCWKEGEEEVAHWHSLEGGFPARKPLEPPLF